MRVLLLLLLFASNVSSASIVSAISDSDTTINPLKKEYKISKTKFIDRYWKDNNEITVINYFFKKRNRSGWVPILISLPIAAAATIFLTLFPESLIIIFLLLLITGGIVLSIIGLVYLLVFPRKRLWGILTQYSANGKLPKNVRRKLRL